MGGRAVGSQTGGVDLFICQQTGKEAQVAGPCREHELEGETYKKGSALAGPLSSLCAALSQFLVSHTPSLTGNPSLFLLCLVFPCPVGTGGPCWFLALSFWFYSSVSFLGLCVFCVPLSFYVLFLVLVSAVWLTSCVSPSPNVSQPCVEMGSLQAAS